MAPAWERELIRGCHGPQRQWRSHEPLIPRAALTMRSVPA